MQSMVVYSSQSGNTGVLAEAVYETLSYEKAIYPVGGSPGGRHYRAVQLPGPGQPKVLEKVAKKQPPPVWLADAPRLPGTRIRTISTGSGRY